ncbi:MAG: AGE family epimerase/isomerase [Verrucomicrobia bacterium]|nr:AGE family epimerase/isomerase [Verrucomicrobiota bacterium]
MPAEVLRQYAAVYRAALLQDVIPFWLRQGMDHEFGGIITSLDRDGAILDTDKSVWFQGRAAWMFATLHNTVEQRAEWLEAARSCIGFLRRHCFSPAGKLYFTVTREGRPLRMRRYVFSEAFAAIANAAYAKASGDARAAEDARTTFATFLRHSFTPGVMPPKFEPARPMKSIGPHMIGIVTAQELRANLGDVEVAGRTCTEWVDWNIAEIERDFVKPGLEAVMETVGPRGEILDHFDGRTLNPGHAIECAWFILHEGRLRGEHKFIQLGLNLLDWMWSRGWDEEHGGLFYFRDLRGLPVQEYWHDMKFWWPQCEAIIATLLAFQLTGQEKYARWHRRVHEWSFKHFPDPEFGEWYGYLHRDGRVSVRLKGNLWKGPFHLPRMLWYCWRLCEGKLPE